MNEDSLPNLVLLSDEGPKLTSAGGILLSRLLQDYPLERLHVLEREMTVPGERLSCAYAQLRPPWRRFEGSRFHRWKRSLRALGLVPPISIRRIEELLQGFRPQVVLTVMQHAAYYDTAWRYAVRRRLPLVAIVHDVNEQFEPVLPIVVAAMRRRDGRFYRFATRRLCISPQMERLCAERYGVPGDVLYPNRSEDLRPRPLEDALRLKQDDALTIAFVGNPNYGYGEELVRQLPALRAVGARLILFGSRPGGASAGLLEASDCVDYRGFMPAMEAWRAVQAECDAVILPYPNPAGRLEVLYRHHFPSKLPEYLALGMPVIVTGPPWATGVDWALRNREAAVVWTSGDRMEFEQLLRRLSSDGTWRVSLSRRAREVGDRDFEPLAIRRAFLDHLRAAWEGKEQRSNAPR